MADDPTLTPLGQFTPEGHLTPGHGNSYLFFVGRDEELHRQALLDLSRQLHRGTETELGFLPGLLPVKGLQVSKGKLQVARSRHLQGLAPGLSAAAQQQGQKARGTRAHKGPHKVMHLLHSFSSR